MMCLATLILSCGNIGFTAESVVSFTDVDTSSWYYSNVTDMAKQGFIKGYEDGSFHPEENITEAEFTAILLRALNNGSTSSERWDEVVMNTADTFGWYDYRNKPTESGGTPITRIKAAITLIRAIKEPCGNVWGYESYISHDGIPTDCLDFALAAYAKGIMVGSNELGFDPSGALTRAEACAIIDRAVLHLDGRTYPLVRPGDSISHIGIKPKKVIAGMYANYIIDENDTLWGWGSNRNGMLGVGYASCYEAFPLKIMENVKSVNCGISHNFLISNNNELYVWGPKDTLDLFKISYSSVNTFAPVKIMDDVKYALALEGDSIIVKNNGEAWAYGMFTAIEQANYSESNQMPEPRKIADGVKKVGWARLSEDNGYPILKENGELWYWTIPYNATYNKEEKPEKFEKIADSIEDINAFMYLFAKDKEGRFWDFSGNSRFEAAYKDADSSNINASDALIFKPRLIDKKINVMGQGWIGYLFTDENNILYGCGLPNRGEKWEDFQKQFKLMDNVIDASFGWSQGLCMTLDGMIYQFGTTWSGSYSENAWDSDNRTPMPIFLSDRPQANQNSAQEVIDTRGATDNVTVRIVESTKFTQEEIQQAIDAVIKKFPDFVDCELTELWYDEAKSDREVEGYMSGGKGSVNGVKKENVLVLFSNFNTGVQSGEDGLNANSRYSNWNWILIRDDANSPWQVDDWGY